jgi:hypothetical protein
MVGRCCFEELLTLHGFLLRQHQRLTAMEGGPWSSLFPSINYETAVFDFLQSVDLALNDSQARYLLEANQTPDGSAGFDTIVA